MTIQVEILCINKTDRFNAYERIRSIGGKNPNGERWRLSLNDAIEGLENGKWSFFVSSAGRTVSVVVATSHTGNKYLKTIADGDQPDNLLSLPECP